MTSTFFDNSILERIKEGKDFLYPYNQIKFEDSVIIYKGKDKDKPYINISVEDFLRFLDKDVSDSIGGKNYREFAKDGSFFSCGSSARLALYSFSQYTDKANPIKHIIIDNQKYDISNKHQLEKSLNIRKADGKYITKAHLDVFLQTTQNSSYFLEVKCHEIFKSHKTFSFSRSYDDIIQNIFGIDQASAKHKSSDFGLEVDTILFDFKQLMSHLLGIYQYQAESKHLIYMFYFPREWQVDCQFRKTFEKLDKELKVISKWINSLGLGIYFGYFYANQFNTIKSVDLINHASYY